MPAPQFNTANKKQLVVMFREDPNDVLSKSKGMDTVGLTNDQQKLLDLIATNKIILSPLFPDIEKAKMVFSKSIKGTAHPGYIYYVSGEEGAQLDKVKQELLNLGVVDAAYFKPASSPPLYIDKKDFAGKLRAEGNTKNIIDDLTANQTYLNEAPNGVDARFAWTIAGGNGAGVNIIDVEGGWNFQHEDLSSNSKGLISGFNFIADDNWLQHGTAVLGEIGGDTNSFGISGISPEASLGAVSIFLTSENDFDTAKAIINAADSLRAGDILLVEQHRPGPNSPDPENSQEGFIALEWWPDDYLAIRYATGKGIIVIEAAGNGSQHLNDAVHNMKPEGFPEWWENPFNRADGLDSGAILVGAGAPPPGTNGEDWGPARSRLDFSNFGACIDAQGWGRSVTTSGYGDVHGNDPDNKKEWYTHSFAGTSSASPIVTGVAACLQGIQRAASRPLLTPARMRELFRTTGTAQQASAASPVTENIGNLPDLRQLIAAL